MTIPAYVANVWAVSETLTNNTKTMTTKALNLEQIAKSILTAQQPAALIRVNADSFHAWRKAAAMANAAAKESDALKMAAGLPSTEQLMIMLNGNTQAVVVDGNGKPIGKVSLANHPEKTVGAFIAARWS